MYRGSVASRADLGEVVKPGKVAKCRADDGRCILGDTRFVLQDQKSKVIHSLYMALMPVDKLLITLGSISSKKA